VRTSVTFTHFMRGDWQRALETDTDEIQWVTNYVLPLIGREAEAVERCRRFEERPLPATMRMMIQAHRTALEGRRDECAQLVARFRTMRPFDPEAIFLSARMLARIGDPEGAQDLLAESIDHGFFCPSILQRDPWLDSLRGKPRFGELVARAEARSRDAEEAFRRLGGERLLGA
jgi:hypothetical protein